MNTSIIEARKVLRTFQKSLEEKTQIKTVDMRGVQKCVRGIVLFYVYEYYYRVLHNSHIERTQKKERKGSGK